MNCFRGLARTGLATRRMSVLITGCRTNVRGAFVKLWDQNGTKLSIYSADQGIKMNLSDKDRRINIFSQMLRLSEVPVASHTGPTLVVSSGVAMLESVSPSVDGLLGVHGVSFVPLSDATGTSQLVCDSKEWGKVVESLKAESVVRVRGVVKARPNKDVSKAYLTGAIEVQLEDLEVLNEAQILPFSLEHKAPPKPFLVLHCISAENKAPEDAMEELRLRERQLDLRRPTMQHNLRLRSQVAMAMREFLVQEHGFVEVETPTLFRRTAEGAREFIVPTRNPGKFYSLAQSPQQYKQLLMVGGFDRYFQFARCYRDEDLRADRQPEFTQVDMEMSFVDPEGIMSMVEELLSSTLRKCAPKMKFTAVPFPRLKYKEAIETYGSDKPDTRYGMELQNLNHIWQQCCSNSGESEVGTLHLHGFRVPHWEESYKLLTRKGKDLLQDQMKAHFHAVIVNRQEHQLLGATIYGQSFSNELAEEVLRGNHELSRDLIRLVMEELHIGDGDLCVLGAWEQHSRREAVMNILGSVRTQLAAVLANSGHLQIDPGQLNFLWVTDFPLFTIDEDTHEVQSTHHPFTAPTPRSEQLLFKSNNPSQLDQVQGQHYDLVVNGVELGGGSIRIHKAEQQEHVLRNILKLETDEFSHLLKGLQSGCPPHGGIALGFDRLMAVLCQAGSLRDVIAFPKSFLGKDLLTGAPTEVDSNELASYHISVVNSSRQSN